MGLFFTYCKKCDAEVSYFGCETGYTCKLCGEINSQEDVQNAFCNPNYFPKLRAAILRKNKIEKFLGEENG